MRERSKGLRGLVASVVIAWAMVGCADPYKQTVAAPGGDDYPAFARAMEKLSGEEKRLVNEYVARREREGVRPVGVTVREAIDEEAKYEREQAELVAKLSHGVGRVVDVAGRVLAGALPSAPGAPPADGAAAPPTARPDPASAPPAPPAPPANPTALPGPTAPPSPPVPTGPAAAPSPPTPPSPPAAPAPTAPPAPTAVAAAMTPEQFAQFIESVESTPFAHERVARVKAMPGGQRVTTAQSIALAQSVPHPSLQVEVLAALYPRVVDPQNFESAYGTLAFPDDRERLRNRVRALR